MYSKLIAILKGILRQILYEHRCNMLLRLFANQWYRKKLKNKDFTLVASDCCGAVILHDLGLKFRSPFVNLWLQPGDFIKYLQNISYYETCKLKFIDGGVNYPVGMLDDIKIYFQHYKTQEAAERKWIQRTERINMDNFFVLFTDRNGCTYQNLLEFDALPYKNKIVFTHKPYPEIKSAFYIHGYEEQDSVGVCIDFRNRFTWKRYLDDFDYVTWFNEQVLI